jgi:hypothetical protein
MRRRSDSVKLSTMNRWWLIILVSGSAFAADPESPTALVSGQLSFGVTF